MNVLETRSLGGRQAIYVIGYEQERFLIASSPAGVNFLSAPADRRNRSRCIRNKLPMPCRSHNRWRRCLKANENRA